MSTVSTGLTKPARGPHSADPEPMDVAGVVAGVVDGAVTPIVRAGRGKLARLEALRGLAAGYVVLHHLLPQSWYVYGINVGILFRFGQEAVILFFLLSGFVIHYSFTRGRDKSFRGYLLKRALRIYVPLIAVLVTSYLVASAHAGTLVDAHPEVLVGNLLMLQDWVWSKPNVVVRTYLGNTPLWSLAYEWWFYMLYWPLWRLFAGPDDEIAPASRRRRDVLVLSVALAAALVYTRYPTFVPRILMYFGLWWAGVMMAEAYMNGRIRVWRRVLPPLAVLAAITGVLGVNAWFDSSGVERLIFARHPIVEFRHFLFATFAIAVALVWQRFEWRGFDTLTRPGLLLAPVSYALYISHWFLLAEARYLDFIGQPLLELAGYVAVTLAFCWLVECVLYPAVRRRAMPALLPSRR